MDKKEKTKAALAKLFEHNGLSAKDFSVKLGFPYATVGTWVRGEIAVPPKKLKKIADYYGFGVEQLLAGEPPPKRSPQVIQEEFEDDGRRIPIVGLAQAGTIARDYQDICNQMNEWVRGKTKDPNAFAVRIVGHSMEDYAHPGDVAIFDPNREPINGEAVLVKLKDSEDIMFKWFFTRGEMGQIAFLASEASKKDPINFKPLEVDRRTGIDFIYPIFELRPRRQSRSISEFLSNEKQKKKNS